MTPFPSPPNPDSLVKALQLVQVANRYNFLRREERAKLLAKALSSS